MQRQMSMGTSHLWQQLSMTPDPGSIHPKGIAAWNVELFFIQVGHSPRVRFTSPANSILAGLVIKGHRSHLTLTIAFGFFSGNLDDMIGSSSVTRVSQTSPPPWSFAVGRVRTRRMMHRAPPPSRVPLRPVSYTHLTLPTKLEV